MIWQKMICHLLFLSLIHICIPLRSLFTEVPVGKVKTYDTAKAVFESFVGSNYDVAYNDLKIINIANISYVTIKVTITLVDDSGNRISRDYITSNEVGFKDGAPINLSITIDKAEKEMCIRDRYSSIPSGFSHFLRNV